MAITRLPGFIIDSTTSFTFANVSVTSNVTASNANLGNAATANFFIGNGSLLTGIIASGGTATKTANGTSNVDITTANGNITMGVGGTGNVVIVTTTGVNVAGTLNATGNLTAANANLGNLVIANFFAGNGSSLTSITGANVTGGVSFAATANAVAGANVSGAVAYATTANAVAGANVSGQVANALVAGTVYTAAQPNITSVGTLDNLNISGNATLGNLVTANFFTGNGSLLSSLTFGNITTFSTAGITTDELYLPSTTRLNVTASGSSGYLFDQHGATINPAIYVTSGQTLAFNLNVSGHPFLIQTSGGANYNVGLEHVDSTGTVLTTSSAQGQVAGTLYWKIPYGITGNYKYICSIHGGMNGNIVVTDANVANITVGLATYATTANAVAGANVSGQVGNALIADTVYTAAQPNITSVGTLTSLAVTGNITSGNANLGNAVTANYFIGDGSMLTGITGGGGGGGGTPGGANTYIQFNDGSVFAGNAGLTFNKTNTVLTANNLVVTATTNLGAVSNITVTGGVGGQVLGTNGSNILSWITPATTSITSTTGITVDTFTGDGSTVVFTLSVTPATITQTQVNYNGVLQLRSAYTLTGSTIIFSTAPISGSLIEITTTQGVSATSGSYGVRSYTGTGSLTTFTVTNGSTTSSVLVTENGVLQTPTTDYTVSGTVLTFTTAPANGVSIQIRELGIFVVNTTSPTTTDILSPFLLMGA
jgi:plastocyanin